MSTAPITPSSITQSPASLPQIGPIPGFNAPVSFPTDAMNFGADPLTALSMQMGNFSSQSLAFGTQNELPDSTLNIPGLSSSLNSASTPSTTPSTVSSVGSTIVNAIAGSSNGSSLLGLSLGRVGAFLLGLVFIAGGIYLFGRPSITAAAGGAIKAATVV